jgi:hypothetical protein
MSRNPTQQGRHTPPLKITEDKKIKEGWHFLVAVGGPTDPTHHYVTVQKNYWHTLTQGKVSPQELVRRSFGFLLERESIQSILTEFNLSVISQYFPDYETTIRSQLTNR